MSKPLNVLQLCLRVPLAGNDGGSIAMLSIANSLLEQGDLVSLRMLALNTRKHYVDINKLEGHVVRKYQLETAAIDTSVKLLPALLNLFSSQSYNVSRFYGEAFDKLLTQTLRETNYDVVILESIFMSPYLDTIRANSTAKVVLRTHNAEHIIWERLAMHEASPLKRRYLKLLARRLKNYEAQIMRRIDALLPMTEEDDRLLRGAEAQSIPSCIIPVAVNTSSYSDAAAGIPATGISLFHLGSMDWMPNLEGVTWFLNNCWTSIHEKFPALKLYLAGRNFPASLMKDAPSGVLCEGEISDAVAYMKDKPVMLVPLLSGGGMRVKILQGMAAGKTIISTTIGAEGIRYINGKNILIADTPEEFLMQVSRCMNDNAFCLSIGKETRKLAEEQYSLSATGRQLAAFLTKLTGNM